MRWRVRCRRLLTLFKGDIMPCYEENIYSVQWSGKSKAILEKIGVVFQGQKGYWTNNLVEIDLEKGLASSPYQSKINALKRLYSTETVRQAAKRQGWQVKAVSEKEFQLIKY